MTLLKATLCLTLIFAAAVLFPLRRAQQAFAARTGTTGVTSTGRPKLRRRPGRVILAAHYQGEIEARESAAPVRVKAPRRRRTVSTVAHVRSASPPRHVQKQSAQRQTPAAHDSGAAAHCDFAPPGRVTRLPQPECLGTPAANPPLSVTTQAVGDIPEPPPKLTL
jgi:hypothetical protein